LEVYVIFYVPLKLVKLCLSARDTLKCLVHTASCVKYTVHMAVSLKICKKIFHIKIKDYVTINRRQMKKNITNVTGNA